jgi:hypothetical protein
MRDWKHWRRKHGLNKYNVPHRKKTNARYYLNHRNEILEHRKKFRDENRERINRLARKSYKRRNRRAKEEEERSKDPDAFDNRKYDEYIIRCAENWKKIEKGILPCFTKSKQEFAVYKDGIIFCAKRKRKRNIPSQ